MLLLLKLTLAPVLVAVASLIGRRWGPLIGGWVAGFPVVAGPVLFFFAAEQGVGFAAQASHGTLVGLISLSVFCLVYAWVAHLLPALPSLLLGWIAFGLATFALQAFSPSLGPALALSFAALGGALFLLPKPAAVQAGRAPGDWDLVLRMGATAGLVLTLTGLAAWLGPRFSGLLTPFPVATSILLAFTRRQQGAAACIGILRGLLISLFGFVVFCWALATVLPAQGIAVAFTVASALCAGFNLAVFWARSARFKHTRTG